MPISPEDLSGDECYIHIVAEFPRAAEISENLR